MRLTIYVSTNERNLLRYCLFLAHVQPYDPNSFISANFGGHSATKTPGFADSVSTYNVGRPLSSANILPESSGSVPNPSSNGDRIVEDGAVIGRPPRPYMRNGRDAVGRKDSAENGNDGESSFDQPVGEK
ncbi:hypothetical protein GWI33_021073 [Rhynchophorus ferrugineus]|uniref:Uncharacterized protein n=1 Tax=Rhynchophorus ferrugineus TaxID=354439 RepID=A0A834M555_RHYFE|nr:hypothetical protein GWI33_021073 [Rhynchophorus ferrugineus]